LSWADYAAAARRLATVRNADAQRQIDVATRIADASNDLTALLERLERQRERIVRLSGRPITPPRIEADGTTDYRTPAEHAVAAAERADAAIERATKAALLPGMPPAARTTVVYAAAAVAWLLLSSFFAESGLLMLCLLLPTFGAARIVLVLFGRGIREEPDPHYD
jgi:hypothetical protein